MDEQTYFEQFAGDSPRAFSALRLGNKVRLCYKTLVSEFPSYKGIVGTIVLIETDSNRTPYHVYFGIQGDMNYGEWCFELDELEWVANE